MTTQKSTMFDRLLKQSILTLCKEAIVFDDNLVIDGIICLTCDGGLQQVIKVHELFLKVGNKSPNATMPASGASSVEIRQSTQEPNVQCVNNASLEVSNNASTSRESEGIKRVADVNAAATADTNNNRTNAEVNEAATADTNNNRTNAEVNAAVTADTHNNRTNAEVNTFQEHVKKFHPKSKNLSCEQCEFVGSSELILNKHMLSHGPSKLYSCPNCLSIFSDAFLYTDHLRSHKTNICKTTYACCFCDAVLPSYNRFQRHEHIHDPSRRHTCRICQKQFSQSTSLKEHMSSHIAEPRVTVATPTVGSSVDTTDDYRCMECQHGFSSLFQLQTHIMKTHEPDPFICERANEEGTTIQTTSASDFKTPTSGLGRRKGNTSKRINKRGVLNKGKSVYDKPTQLDAGSVYDEPTQLDAGSVYDEHTQNDDYTESGTPHVMGTTAAAASMGGQTRRKTSTGRANTPIQKDWKIPDLSEISAERQKTTDINAAADGETAAKRPKLTTEVTIKVDQLDDASNESFATDLPTQYSKTSVLGMETDFSSADHLSSAYTNTKVRPPPVFEKVVTPDTRYRTGTRPYKCGECGDSFFRVGNLKCHTASKHAPKLYTCGVCNKAFAYRKQLEKHFTAYPEHTRQ